MVSLSILALPCTITLTWNCFCMCQLFRKEDLLGVCATLDIVARRKRNAKKNAIPHLRVTPDDGYRKFSRED